MTDAVLKLVVPLTLPVRVMFVPLLLTVTASVVAPVAVKLMRRLLPDSAAVAGASRFSSCSTQGLSFGLEFRMVHCLHGLNQERINFLTDCGEQCMAGLPG